MSSSFPCPQNKIEHKAKRCFTHNSRDRRPILPVSTIQRLPVAARAVAVGLPGRGGVGRSLGLVGGVVRGGHVAAVLLVEVRGAHALHEAHLVGVGAAPVVAGAVGFGSLLEGWRILAYVQKAPHQTIVGLEAVTLY